MSELDILTELDINDFLTEEDFLAEDFVFHCGYSEDDAIVAVNNVCKQDFPILLGDVPVVECSSVLDFE